MAGHTFRTDRFEDTREAVSEDPEGFLRVCQLALLSRIGQLDKGSLVDPSTDPRAVGRDVDLGEAPSTTAEAPSKTADSLADGTTEKQGRDTCTSARIALLGFHLLGMDRRMASYFHAIKDKLTGEGSFVVSAS